MKISNRPILITDAAASHDEQFAARKRRYVLLMSARLVLFVLAAVTYTVSPWAAVGLLAFSVPLPWMAVLIANGGPVRRSDDTHRVATARVRHLENRSPHVIAGSTDQRVA